MYHEDTHILRLCWPCAMLDVSYSRVYIVILPSDLETARFVLPDLIILSRVGRLRIDASPRLVIS